MTGEAEGATPAPGPPRKRGRGRTLTALGVFGAVIAIVLLALALGLLLIHGSARDDHGFYSSGDTTVAAGGFAMTTDEIDLGTDADWVPEEVLGEVRLRAAGLDGEPVFVGIGPSDEVEGYLGGVARSELTDLDDGGEPVLAEREGGRPSEPPEAAGVWSVQVEGEGEQEVVWDPEPGTWTAVVMNADGSRGVAADVSIGIKIGWLPWVGIALGVAGLGVGWLSGLAIVRGSRRRTAARAASVQAARRGE